MRERWSRRFNVKMVYIKILEREEWTRVEEPTLEERCFTQALENQKMVSVDEVMKDSIGSLYEQLEDLYDL